MNKVLIVIDAQEDFARGSLRNEEAIKALLIIHDIVKFAVNNKMTIAYTADTHGEDYMNTQEGKNLPVLHCIYKTHGWNICPEIIDDEYPYSIIMKETFGYTGWDKQYNVVSQKIKTADEVWLCGFCTDICVSANFQLLKAYYPEVPIVVISDGCAGTSRKLHDAALMVMKSCQARIVNWSELKHENEVKDN